MTNFTATRDEATSAILGAVLLAGQVALDILTTQRIRPAHLYYQRDQTLLQGMLDLAETGDPIDEITLAAQVQHHWPDTKTTPQTAIASYAGGVPAIGNLRNYCEIVKEYAYFEGVEEAAYRAAEAADRHDREGVLTALSAIDTSDDAQDTPIDAATAFLDWYESAATGIPLPFTKLTDAVGGGLQAGEVAIFGGWPGHGKALAINTPVPTPDGWRTMGDIKDGDRVFGADGTPTAVLMAHPIRANHRCYEITFSDGSTIVADEAHLWQVQTRASRRSAVAAAARSGQPIKRYGTDQSHKRATPEVLMTLEIAEAIKTAKTRFSIPVSAPIQYPTADLPMDPYLLGLWLGDGTTIYPIITVGDEDRDHVIEQLELAGQRVSVHKGRTAWNVRFLGGLKLLRAAGVLGDKHVPSNYLTASVDQRTALLQGLVDSDGTIDKQGRCEITVTRARLAEGILDLVLSLGLRATMQTQPAKINRRIVGTRHRICFTTDMQICRLPRKATRLPKKIGSRATHRYIVAVTPVESVPVRCITVEATDSLYLVGRAYIATHNTFFAKDTMLAARSGGARCHEYANEMSGPRLTGRLISSLCGIPAERIRNRELNHEEWKQVNGVLKNLPYETSPSAGWSVEDYCRDLRKQRWDLAVIDTVTNLPCKNTSEWDRACTMLSDTAAQCGTALILVSQLNKERDTGQIKPPPTGRDLRNTGAWYMRARVVLFVHRDQYILEGTEIAMLRPDGHIRVEKATHGEPELGFVNVTFNPRFLRFEDANDYRRLEVVA